MCFPRPGVQNSNTLLHVRVTWGTLKKFYARPHFIPVKELALAQLLLIPTIPIKPESLGVEFSISILFLSFPVNSIVQQSLRIIALNQCCPIELCPIMENALNFCCPV